MDLRGMESVRGLAVAVAWATMSTMTQPGLAQMSPTSGSQPTFRKTVPLSADVNSALRAEAISPSAAARLLAVRRLATLHDELSSHERFSQSELLQRDYQRIRLRLLNIYHDLSTKEHGEPNTSDSSKADNERREAPASIDRTTEVLAQAIGPIGGPGGGPGRGPGGGVAGGLGGPGGPVGPAAAGPDYSVELIDIITRTITPDTWDVVGGPSSIGYYRQGMALVVRAPQAVHEKMAQLLQDLRAAGP